MILIINNHSKKNKKLEAILRNFDVPYIVKDQRSYLKGFRIQHKVKGVILTGGKPDLDKKINLNKIRADLVCLINYDVPILGICEGHELIAYTSGGAIRRLKKRFKTNAQIVKICSKKDLFKGLPDKIIVTENHSGFVDYLPDFFELTATSRKDRVEGISHKEKPIFGVQFHPETSGEFGVKILKNFVKICYSK